MTQKKQPVRMCAGCGERKLKKELIRVVRTPEGEILVDRIGKKSGRGAYLCDEASLDDQHRLAELTAEGLRRMWDVDITGCPSDRTLDRKFREIEAGLREGRITMEAPCIDFEKDAAEALKRLKASAAE